MVTHFPVQTCTCSWGCPGDPRPTHPPTELTKQPWAAPVPRSDHGRLIFFLSGYQSLCSKLIFPKMWLFVPRGKTQAEFRQYVDELFYVFILVLIRKKKNWHSELVVHGYY